MSKSTHEDSLDYLFDEVIKPFKISHEPYKPLPNQQVYVSTADIRDTIAYWKSIQPPLTKIKVKSEFYDGIVKVFPPITWSDMDVEDIHGVQAEFTRIPIEIDDEIEDDYELVYGEENTK